GLPFGIGGLAGGLMERNCGIDHAGVIARKGGKEPAFAQCRMRETTLAAAAVNRREGLLRRFCPVLATKSQAGLGEGGDGERVPINQYLVVPARPDAPFTPEEEP